MAKFAFCYSPCRHMRRYISFSPVAFMARGARLLSKPTVLIMGVAAHVKSLHPADMPEMYFQLCVFLENRRVWLCHSIISLRSECAGRNALLESCWNVFVMNLGGGRHLRLTSSWFAEQLASLPPDFKNTFTDIWRDQTFSHDYRDHGNCPVCQDVELSL